jgi:hypothetical protein
LTASEKHIERHIRSILPIKSTGQNCLIGKSLKAAILNFRTVESAKLILIDSDWQIDWLKIAYDWLTIQMLTGVGYSALQAASSDVHEKCVSWQWLFRLFTWDYQARIDRMNDWMNDWSIEEWYMMGTMIGRKMIGRNDRRKN